MPILWRYALQSYLRVFSLSVCTFIAVLLIARFKEIARFTALSGNWSQTGLFIVYQVPTILPIAIPISALLASLLFFQKMSRTSELNALRSSGLSFTNILTPLLFLSIALSILNFSLCAEIAPYCRREGKTLIYHATSQNPLLLLQRQNLVKIKHAYLDMNIQNEETTQDLTLIVHNEKNERLSLFSARNLRIMGETLLGGDLAIISYLNSAEGSGPLILENQSTMSTSAPLLSMALKKNRPRIDLNALNLRMLRLSPKIKPARIEILRRLSLSLSTFSFTLLGAAFGIESRRNPSKKHLILGLFLTLLILMSYLLGKELKNSYILSSLAFLLPHPFSWGCSLFHLYRIARGKL